VDLRRGGDGHRLGIELVELIGRLRAPGVAQGALDRARRERIACLPWSLLELGRDLVSPRPRDPLQVDRAGGMGEHDPPAGSRTREPQADLEQRIDPAQRVGAHRDRVPGGRGRRCSLRPDEIAIRTTGSPIPRGR